MTSGEIYADLYKLNSYSEGGFFKAHRDTPKGNNHIGTIVVGLPSIYSGGELVVHHGGNSQIFDWAPTAKDGIVNWAFLYSDCEHEILPVASGTRLSLSYDVFASPTPTPSTALENTCFPFHSHLATLLRRADFLPEGGKVAFALEHAYPLPTAAEQSTSERNEDFVKSLPGRLKGFDAVLYAVGRSLGLAPQLKALYCIDASSMAEARDKYGLENHDTEGLSEDEQEDRMFDDIYSETCGPLVEDEHLPQDDYSALVRTGRFATVHGPREAVRRDLLGEYYLTGETFTGGGNPEGDGRDEYQVLTEDAEATLEGDSIWARRPAGAVRDAGGPWTEASSYQAYGNEVRLLELLTSLFC